MSAHTNGAPPRAERHGALMPAAAELGRGLALLADRGPSAACYAIQLADTFELLRKRSEEAGLLMLLGELLASTVDQLADERTPRKRLPALQELARTQVRALRDEIERQRKPAGAAPAGERAR